MTGNEGDRSRRTVLKTVGAVGTGLAGVSSLPTVGNANPTVCSADGDGSGIEPACGSGGGGSGFEINVAFIKDRVSKDEVCVLLAAGCGIGTVALAVDTVPYDAVVFARACGGALGGCQVWQVFRDKHGDQPATVFRAQESGGPLDKGDYIMVPSAWNWTA